MMMIVSNSLCCFCQRLITESRGIRMIQEMFVQPTPVGIEPSPPPPSLAEVLYAVYWTTFPPEVNIV